jgi:hypothetical protein
MFLNAIFCFQKEFGKSRDSQNKPLPDLIGVSPKDVMLDTKEVEPGRDQAIDD